MVKNLVLDCCDYKVSLTCPFINCCRIDFTFHIVVEGTSYSFHDVDQDTDCSFHVVNVCYLDITYYYHTNFIPFNLIEDISYYIVIVKDNLITLIGCYVMVIVDNPIVLISCYIMADSPNSYFYLGLSLITKLLILNNIMFALEEFFIF